MQGRTTSVKLLYLILTCSRSGSDWLISMLGQHPALCAMQTLIPHSKASVPLQQLGKSGFPMALLDVAVDALSNGRAHRKTKECRVMGWKDSYMAAVKNRAALTNWLRRRNVSVILLERQGLEREVSKARNDLNANLSSHCWTEECAREIASVKVTMDVPKLLSDLDSNRRSWEEVRSWASHELPSNRWHHLTYGRLDTNTQPEMDVLFRFLGLEPLADNFINNTATFPTLVKTSSPPSSSSSSASSSSSNDDDIARDILNADEVLKALAGTPWGTQTVPRQVDQAGL